MRAVPDLAGGAEPAGELRVELVQRVDAEAEHVPALRVA
jgi:hypothetical protein